MKSQSSVEIFQSPDGKTNVAVTFDGATVWLTQEQLTVLFERDRTVIGRHIRNIFREGELDEKVVCANFAHTTQHGAIKGKTQSRSNQYYNLDVIISVGYRVRSLRGTQFRQWANQRIKEYLLQGYAINQKRLEQTDQEVRILRSGIQILSRAIEEKTRTEGQDWLTHFSKGLKLLDDYDHESLDAKGLTIRPVHYPTMPEYQELVDQMKADFGSDVFGIKKDQSFESAIGQLSKGFGDDDFYPSIEEKAAMLLYLVIKNHAFTDGNKRIGAACFLLFLETNSALRSGDGTPLISNEALASITLFVAASRPEEMQTVKRLVMSILNRNKN